MLPPATRSDKPFSGVNAYNNGFAEIAARFFNQLRVFYSSSPKDDAVNTGFKRLFYCLQLTDASTQLDRNQDGAGYLSNNVPVMDFTRCGAIKVNDMQPCCAERLPLQGDVYRVIREYGLLVIITLIESDAPAFSEVYSWNYFYVTLPPCLELEVRGADAPL